jgi:hypothetical protein
VPPEAHERCVQYDSCMCLNAVKPTAVAPTFFIVAPALTGYASPPSASNQDAEAERSMLTDRLSDG